MNLDTMLKGLADLSSLYRENGADGATHTHTHTHTYVQATPQPKKRIRLLVLYLGDAVLSTSVQGSSPGACVPGFDVTPLT